jgi:hypothetical protein
MSLSSTTSRYRYLANGATVAFAFSALFLDNTHLQVVVSDTEGNDTTKVLGTDYSVTGALNPSGGTVTFVTAPTSGHYVTIRRVVPMTQAVDYVPNDSFPAETHETALDKLTMLVQQLSEGAGRSITFPTTEPSTTSGVLDPAVLRKNKLLGFSGAGLIEYYDLLEEWGVQEINLVKLSDIHPTVAGRSRLEQATLDYTSGGHILIDTLDDFSTTVALVIPSNLILLFMPDYRLELSNMMLFVCNSQIIALPTQKIFDLDYNPEIYLAGTVHVGWFGVSPTAVNNAYNIQKMADALVSTNNVVVWGNNTTYPLTANAACLNKVGWKHEFNNCRFTLGYTIDFTGGSSNTFDGLYRNYRMINSRITLSTSTPVITGQSVLGSDTELATTDDTVTSAVAMTLPAGRGGVVDVLAVGTTGTVQNVFRTCVAYVNVAGAVTTWTSSLMTSINPSTLGGLTVTTAANAMGFSVQGKLATNVAWYLKVTVAAHHGL